MTNIKTLLLPIYKQQLSAYQPNQEPNVEFDGCQQQQRDIKKAFLLNKRNPINANV